MFGLTLLGAIHTAISLLALALGLFALARDRQIVPGSRIGTAYLWITVLTCLTSFGIVEHGGFGKPHALGVVTLVVLGLATLANRARQQGSRWHHAAVLAYTLTVFFHLVPGVTESTTRLPMGAPLLASPDDPALAKATLALFIVFIIVMALQWRQLRRARAGS